MLLDMEVGEFLEDLASAKATPGGGSAAALAGAASAALVSMVARLSPKSDDNQSRLAVVAELSYAYRMQIQELVDEDARAFDSVLTAMKLPKDTPEQRSKRKEHIQKALKHAAAVPLEVMESSLQVLQLAAEVAEIGSRRAVSDAGAAGALAHGAVQAAAYNVRINLKDIADEGFVETNNEMVQRCLQEAEQTAAGLEQYMTDILA